MSSGLQKAPISKTVWAGRILSALPVLLMVGTAVFGMLKPEAVMQGFAHYGYPAGALRGILVVEMGCVLLYAIPRTAVLGAVLLTGYLGGATATHVRVGEPFFIPIIVGIVVWAGIFLREDRLRALLPLRKAE